MEFEFMFMYMAVHYFRIISARKALHRKVLLLRKRIFQRLRGSRGNYAIVSVLPNTEMHQVLCGCPLMSRKHIRVLPRTVDRLVTLLPVKARGWNIRFEVVVFLFWLARGGSYRVVSDMFNIPRSSSHMLCTSVLNSLVRLLPLVIQYPSDGEQLSRIGDGFAKRCQSRIFEKAAGAIDGTHCRVLCPSLCPKQFYSIPMQVVCDQNGAFIDIILSSFPGSVNDERVPRRYPPSGMFLLGDGGYNNILQPIGILAPYHDAGHLTEPMKRFNHQHSKGRNVMESALGSVCERWRCIFQQSSLQVNLSKAEQIITACLILHNVCVSTADVVAAFPVKRPRLPPANVGLDQRAAGQLRNELCARLAAEPPPPDD